MVFSYNKLWKLLIDKNMNKADLRKITGISPNAMARLSKGESVKMEIVGKICVMKSIDFNGKPIKSKVSGILERRWTCVFGLSD